jgi:hypothetical protein
MMGITVNKPKFVFVDNPSLLCNTTAPASTLKKKSNAIDFRLKPAKTIAFQVLGLDKKPLAETDVVLLKRKVGTKEHMLYPASVDDAKLSTDDKGILKVSFLNEGETAEFGVLIFGELQSVEVKVSAEAEQVIVVQKKR